MPQPLDEEDWRKNAQSIADEIAGAAEPDPGRAATSRCAGDQDLLAEVLGLIGEFPSRTEDPLINQRVGSYRIQKRLGGGGNGDVYLATRLSQTNQIVAIKFLRVADGSNDEFRRRFLRECQILSLINHPYIVKLFDPDRTRAGRPYFVMEYVAGKTLDEYAAWKRLTVRGRLGLFLKLCEAVQFLHTRLIVHRDLKPQNILIDEAENPRVLDFGIAKLLQPEFLDGEPITIAERQPLTAQYASPEQWLGDVITVASDVYSLGVVLFELLTGRQPVVWEGKPASECQKLVCEGKLPLASQSVSGAHAASCRESNSAALSAQLTGDLDAIISKALSLEPQDRYPSVASFAEDIERHLQFVPVRARRSAPLYRARRFVRRNRQICLSISVIVALVGASMWLLIRERNRADDNLRAARESATREAENLRELPRDMLSRFARNLEAWAGSLEREDPDGYQSLTTRLLFLEQSIKYRASAQDEDGVRADQARLTDVKTQLKKLYGRGPAVIEPSFVSASSPALARAYDALAMMQLALGDPAGAKVSLEQCGLVAGELVNAGDNQKEMDALRRRCNEGIAPRRP